MTGSFELRFAAAAPAGIGKLSTWGGDELAVSDNDERNEPK